MDEKLKLEQIATSENGLDIRQVLEAANRKGLCLLPNREIDELLKSNGWMNMPEIFPCWTGTLLAYGRAQMPLGEWIEYEGLKIRVPPEVIGKHNVAIVIEHPDFFIDETGLVGYRNESLRSLCPSQRGWYGVDSRKIPCGRNILARNPDARFFNRMDSGFVGLIVRDYNSELRSTTLPSNEINYWKEINATCHIADKHGALGVRRPEKTPCTPQNTPLAQTPTQ